MDFGAIPRDAMAVGVFTSFSVSTGIVLTQALHGRLTLDTAPGVQRMHDVPAPRVGGIGIMLALLLACTQLRPEAATLLTPMLIAGLPAFLAGLAEDLTKRVGVRERLVATLASGLLAWWLTGQSLTSMQLWGVDDLLQWLPLSVAMTAFCVAGMANAVNIVDGFHGLASGVLVVCLAAFAALALLAGDVALAQVCLVTAAVVVGFALVNFPLGKIFLGDGGAYVLGFWLGWIAVLLPQRNEEVSPWASLMICAYLVLEVLFSITRRAISGSSPGVADKEHLHSMLGTCVASIPFAPQARHWHHAMVSPLLWAFAVIPAYVALQLWWDTASLKASFGMAAVLYVVLYLGLRRLAGSSQAVTRAAPLNQPPKAPAARFARKLLFINRYFYPDNSATSQILGDLVFHLAREGEQVCVITSCLRQDGGTALPSDELIQGVQVRRVRSTQFGRLSLVGRAVDYLAFYAGAARVAWQLTDRDTVVIAKTDPPLLSLVAAPIAKLRGAKYINWLQDIYPEVARVLGVGRLVAPLMSLLRTARNITLRCADANVVLGKGMEALVARQGVSAAKLHIIHNWADSEAIHPVKASSNPCRAAWGLEGKFVVGYSGNLGRAHEFQTILAAAHLLKERSDIVFLFIGGGVQRAALEHEARERSMQNLRFLPYQRREQLSESLSAADVHLVCLNPALEGMIVPSKFYGIAAAGRPALFIGDTDGEIPSILQQAGCGFGIRTGDAACLAQTVCSLADAPAVCEELGARARHVLEQQFDRGIAMAAWKKVLRAA